MNFNFCILLFAAQFVGLFANHDDGSRGGAAYLKHKKITRCGQSPRVKLDVQQLISASTLSFSHSLLPEFNCSKVVATQPANNNISYSLIVTTGTSANFLDAKVLPDGYAVQVKFCIEGYSFPYYLMLSELLDPRGGYYVAYACDSEEEKFTYFVVVIKGTKPNPDIERYVIPFVQQVDGTQGIFNAIENCPKPPFCQEFP